jgi:hypothetical protein
MEVEFTYGVRMRIEETQRVGALAKANDCFGGSILPGKQISLNL